MVSRDDCDYVEQAGELVPIPKNLSLDIRQVLETVQLAEAAFSSYSGEFHVRFYPLSTSSSEPARPHLVFLVSNQLFGRARITIELAPSSTGLCWEYHYVALGGSGVTTFPFIPSGYALIFQLLNFSFDLRVGCTEFIGLRVRECADFDAINNYRLAIVSGEALAPDELSRKAAHEYKTLELLYDDEQDEEYEEDEETQLELDDTPQKRPTWLIDADPVNENWLRWKNWKVNCQNLDELFELLGVSNARPETRVRQLKRISHYLPEAPPLLQRQVFEFLTDVASREL